MAEVKTPINIRPSNPSSPPPNCAICLGVCNNKCFSDSCMHQFCFKCLLEWSKIKAECPLCKQSFTSIIHNVKSNSEYDEHVVPPRPQVGDEIPMDRQWFLPSAVTSRHQFHFRTTLTVDPDGEIAIQQMLLSHPFTTNVLPNSSNERGRWRRRRDVMATSFRRSIYADNLWVYAPPDLSGRYRETSPHFYRENPAARQRLVPWLNRELNALLYENTPQIIMLVDRITDYLLRHHIRSSAFRAMLYEYLGSKTEHFIHEFHNFMKSPYDMIGYDRHVTYVDSPRPFISDFEEDSDAAIITTPAQVPTVNSGSSFRPRFEVIEIDSDSSNDSDVIIHEPEPPVVVNLVDTSDSEEEVPLPQPPSPAPAPRRKPILPLKIRLKHRQNLREDSTTSSSTSSTSTSTSTSSVSTSTTSSSDSSTSSSDCEEKKCLKRKRMKKEKGYKLKRKKAKTSPDSDDEDEDGTSIDVDVGVDDYTPLSKSNSKNERRLRFSSNEHTAPTECYNISEEGISPMGYYREIDRDNRERDSYTPPTAPQIRGIYSDLESSDSESSRVYKFRKENRDNGNSYEITVKTKKTGPDDSKLNIDFVKKETDVFFGAGPSDGRVMSAGARKVNGNLWYSRPFDCGWSGSSDED